MDDAMIATDDNGKIQSINAEAAGITGWKAEEALGRDLRDVFRVRSAHPGGGRCNNILVTRTGKEVNVEGRAEGIRDSEGRLTEIRFHFSRCRTGTLLVMPSPRGTERTSKQPDSQSSSIR